MTLVELMVAMTLAFVIGGIALALSLSGKRMYRNDEARTRLNQDLVATMDFLVADIRQAGERLGDDFPALMIIDGGGTSPDQFVSRRNLIDTVLRVCSDTEDDDIFIRFAQTSTPPPGCAPMSDDDGDGWPDNIQAWREERLANGGSMRAYIYNPVTEKGEFFDYVGEHSFFKRLHAASGTTWQWDYPVAEKPVMYLLEERRYELSSGMFQFNRNGKALEPRRIAEGIQNFQATAVFRDWSQQTSLGPGDTWSDLRSIHIDLVGAVQVGNRTVERTWSSDIMPRNILSR